MASMPPGDIATQPNIKKKSVVRVNVYYIRMRNDCAHRICWTAKTTNISRVNVDPNAGVLDPKESVLLAVSCTAFENTTNDRISLEWVNVPEGAAKTFRRELFQGDGMVRRKNVRIKSFPCFP